MASAWNYLRRRFLSAMTDGDELIRQFGDSRMIAAMEKVFFEDGANMLGHCYAKLMHGPGARHDLQDIISLLRAEPSSKRAVLTLCGLGDGKVPCINVIEFLIRDGALRTIYFARGRDAFKKVLCRCALSGEMTCRVADALGLPADTVSDSSPRATFITKTGRPSTISLHEEIRF